MTTETTSYTLHCPCGSEFKVLCPDCGRIHDGYDAEMLEALRDTHALMFAVYESGFDLPGYKARTFYENLAKLEALIAKVEGR